MHRIRNKTESSRTKFTRASTVCLHACAVRLRYVALGATRDYVNSRLSKLKSKNPQRLLTFVHGLLIAISASSVTREEWECNGTADRLLTDLN